MSALPAAMRRAQILRKIEQHGAVTVGELARIHSISTMTAHRDLERLARDGLVQRVHGGARALPDPVSSHPTAWEHRITQAPDAKAAIASCAASLVADGSTIYLDASTTALALASVLFASPPHELTIVTNSPMVQANASGDSVHVVACPGELDQRMRAVTGRWTVEFLQQLHLDIAFVSGAGITVDAGLTTSRSPIADVLNAARDTAARSIGLVDSTKFGRASLVSIARAQDLDLIITDEALPEAAAQQFAQAGAELLRAPRTKQH